MIRDVIDDVIVCNKLPTFCELMCQTSLNHTVKNWPHNSADLNPVDYCISGALQQLA